MTTPIGVLLQQLAPADVLWDSAGLRVVIPRGSSVPRSLLHELRFRRPELLDHLEHAAHARGRILRERLEREHAELARVLAADRARIGERLAAYQAARQEAAA